MPKIREEWEDLVAQARELGSEVEAAISQEMSAFISEEEVLNDDERVRRHWSRAHMPLPEFAQAAETICVRAEWMSGTRLFRRICDIQGQCAQDLDRIKKDQKRIFEASLSAAISKAYSLTQPKQKEGEKDAPEKPAKKAGQSKAKAKGSKVTAKIHNAVRFGPKAQKDLGTGEVIFDKVALVYHNLPAWKKTHFIHALQVLVELDDDTAAIAAKLSECCERAQHCSQAQQHAFDVLVYYAYGLLPNSAKAAAPTSESQEYDDDSTSYNAALLHFYACMEDYMDDHKENAFKSSFQEPSKFYLVQNSMDANNVETHANNFYISLLNATLNVHLPIMPVYWDNCGASLVDFWAGLKPEAWKVFADPDNFGRGFTRLAELHKRPTSLILKKLKGKDVTGFFGDGHAKGGSATAKEFANGVLSPSSGSCRQALAVYLERFSHFFSREFFIRKAFESLNSEMKPTHAGFRKACERLYQTYRLEQRCTEDTLIEHCYQDDMFLDFNLAHVERFFMWLGVLKPPVLTSLGQQSSFGVAPHGAQKSTRSTVAW
jgi:hypothetical protein